MEPNSYETWNAYVAQERAALEPVLAKLGYTLEERQPHISGERFLMQALTTTSGRKLILLGKETASGARAVIKATRDRAGAAELAHERACRNAIHTLPFAYHGFASPKELYFGQSQGFCISIQAFIEQDSSFIERPIAEQFTYALQAFKGQEGAHAATYEQLRAARRTFDHMNAAHYVANARDFCAHIAASGNTKVASLCGEAAGELEQNGSVISQYGNFLTHTDFVPHNFRIADGTLYLLDYSSIRFGNKHEGWARFLNFMSLYNPDLEAAFVKYFSDNRAPEECESLRLMRLYRLTEIIWYYVRASSHSTGALKELNDARIEFWSEVLRAQIERRALSSEVRRSYMTVRDQLRSDEERERQKGLH